MRATIRILGKPAVVLAVVVLVLSGANSARAERPRDVGISRANDFIFNCTAVGGDPVVIMDTSGENLTVLCGFSDGRVSVCQFLPVVKDCQWVTPLKVAPSRTGGTGRGGGSTPPAA